MGSKAAKEKIVSDNTGLVWSIARRFVNRGYDLEELYQIGCIGLLKACDRFEIHSVLEEMVYNLIENAIKYNKEDGTIDVMIKKKKHRCEFCVKDSGIGIPADQLDRIFERFYRVDKSHSKEIGGTGLGLSIVKHGAKLHNAEIKIESALNVGTEINLIFPI